MSIVRLQRIREAQEAARKNDRAPGDPDPLHGPQSFIDFLQEKIRQWRTILSAATEANDVRQLHEAEVFLAELDAIQMAFIYYE